MVQGFSLTTNSSKRLRLNFLRSNSLTFGVVPYEMKGIFSNIQAEQIQVVHERSPRNK